MGPVKMTDANFCNHTSTAWEHPLCKSSTPNLEASELVAGWSGKTYSVPLSFGFSNLSCSGWQNFTL